MSSIFFKKLFLFFSEKVLTTDPDYGIILSEGGGSTPKGRSKERVVAHQNQGASGRTGKTATRVRDPLKRTAEESVPQDPTCLP